MRLPRDKTQTSVSAFQGPYGSHFGAQADLETPLVTDRLSASVSVGAGQKEFDFHTIFYYVEALPALIVVKGELVPANRSRSRLKIGHQPGVQRAVAVRREAARGAGDVPAKGVGDVLELEAQVRLRVQDRERKAQAQ